MAKLNELGQEIPDPTPVSLPAGWQRPPTLHEQIKRFVRSELSRQAEAAGEESFEEADDFEVDEDPDPFSPYEVAEAAQEWPQGVKPVDPDPPLEPGDKSPNGADKASPEAA